MKKPATRRVPGENPAAASLIEPMQQEPSALRRLSGDSIPITPTPMKAVEIRSLAAIKGVGMAARKERRARWLVGMEDTMLTQPEDLRK